MDSAAIRESIPDPGYDDLHREVYCVLGMPIDAIEMPAVLRRIEAAVCRKLPFVLSTPNTNFLISFHKDLEFRESVLLSDLSPADGMPIVWISRFLGIPIRTRVAGADIFEALKAHKRPKGRLKIFLFGATENVSAAAAAELSRDHSSLECVGRLCPGFGNIDQIGNSQFIEEINSSNADFLVVALGATKGQIWLLRNHSGLRVPIRSHLGAVINFQAGTVRRAPASMRRLGLEWLWRIKEEPFLWKRYWHDARILSGLLLTRVIPLAVAALKMRWQGVGHDLDIVQSQTDWALTLHLEGYATAEQVPKIIQSFGEALATGKQIIVDLSGVQAADCRFLGLLLMLRKVLKSRGDNPQFTGLSDKMKRLFWLNAMNARLGPAEN